MYGMHACVLQKKHFVNYAVLTQHSSRKSDQTTVAETYAAEIEAKEGRQKMVVRLETSYVNSAGLEPSEYNKRRSSRSISPRSGKLQNLVQIGVDDLVCFMVFLYFIPLCVYY